MAYAYCIDRRYSVVVVRPSGQFTESQFIELLRAMYNDPDRDPSFCHVWDTRSIHELTMDVDVIPRYKAFLGEHEEEVVGGQVAIIATHATTRLFATMLMEINERETTQTVQLFADVESAAEWLDVPEQTISDVPEDRWVRS